MVNIFQNARRMHAYLIVGGSDNKISECINGLISKYNLTTLQYEITKIEDVRQLKSFINLKVTKPTGIVIQGIEKATIEALNAFLKNLEEPQPSLYYILITPDIRRVISTITSRCQIITLEKKAIDKTLEKYALEFILLPIGEKFLFIDKIKDRKEAMDFIDNIIYGIHPLLIDKNKNIKRMAKILSVAEMTRQSLNLNGNIQLHLTKFIVNI